MQAIQLSSTTYDVQVPLTVGTTDQQNQYLILTSHAGEWKEYPTLGVGIGDYTNETDYTALKYAIRDNFKSDGIKVNSIAISNNNQLTIDAQYANNAD